MLSVILSFDVAFPDAMVTIAILADTPSQSDSLLAFQCFTSGVFGPLENRLIHLSIPMVFVLLAGLFYGTKACHLHFIVRRRHRGLWRQVVKLSQQHDKRIQGALAKLSFKARLFHELDDQVCVCIANLIFGCGMLCLYFGCYVIVTHYVCGE